MYLPRLKEQTITNIPTRASVADPFSTIPPPPWRTCCGEKATFSFGNFSSKASVIIVVAFPAVSATATGFAKARTCDPVSIAVPTTSVPTLVATSPTFSAAPTAFCNVGDLAITLF